MRFWVSQSCDWINRRPSLYWAVANRKGKIAGKQNVDCHYAGANAGNVRNSSPKLLIENGSNLRRLVAVIITTTINVWNPEEIKLDFQRIWDCGATNRKEQFAS